MRDAIVFVLYRVWFWGWLGIVRLGSNEANWCVYTGLLQAFVHVLKHNASFKEGIIDLLASREGSEVELDKAVQELAELLLSVRQRRMAEKGAR